MEIESKRSFFAPRATAMAASKPRAHFGIAFNPHAWSRALFGVFAVSAGLSFRAAAVEVGADENTASGAPMSTHGAAPGSNESENLPDLPAATSDAATSDAAGYAEWIHDLPHATARASKSEVVIINRYAAVIPATTGTAANGTATTGIAANGIPKNGSVRSGAEASVGDDEAASGWSYGGELDFNSRYVWRGLALSSGAVAQPSAWVSRRDYTFSIWGNIELRKGANGLQGPRGRRRFNEVDVTLSRSLKTKKWTLEAGFQIYLYPRASDGASTGEVQLRLSRPVRRASMYALLAVDVLKFKGAGWAEIGLSREHEFNARLSGAAGASLGFGSSRFNRVNLDAKGGALNAAMIDVSLSYALREHLSIRPHASFSALLPERLRGQVDDPTILVVGVALESEF